MGTGLFPVGNHKIQFKKRSFKEIANEIKYTLDNTTFPNAEFLRAFALHRHEDNPRRIREIKNKTSWTFYEEDEYYSFEESKEIEFYGLFGLELTFTESQIIFWNPPYRYWWWFETKDDALRDEWRKYFYHVVHLFGGDRVVYLADNGKHLERFISYEGAFEEMEKELLDSFGPPKKTFQEVADNFDNSYFIDDFKSIDWSRSKTLEEYLPEPDDKSSIAYDLEKYSTKEDLKNLRFQEEELYHKLIDNKIHFFHITRLEGLLCIHTGIVGEKENLEVKLDEYAPFTYDSLVEKIENEGYGYHQDITLIINYDALGKDSWSDAVEEFKKELLWNGIGTAGDEQEHFNYNKIEEDFDVVDEKIALKLLLELGKKHGAKKSIEVYYVKYTDIDIDEEGDKILIYKQ